LKLTFKDKEKIIKKFANEYNKSKVIETRGLNLFDDRIKDENLIYCDTENKYRYYYSLQNKIDTVFENLDYETATFIKMEFFTSQYKNNWWMNYYSRSTYYRIKKRSMESFLGYLYA
jgi:hypothetical protein